ncbi:peroxiredoxin [Paenibacillus glufosinatiresistens]|uniref:peroxiredoxin n=1 Tax=Paenibacillus glufosinatiresistens TaxID=3070657 RepID=UPI00286E6FD6|nr:peroxiredoxin [Paenibacillus sp. YX.27]
MAERMVGRSAPDFKLETVSGDGREFKWVSLSDYREKWLVLFFYPLDFTYVCPTEIRALSEAAGQFSDLDTELLAVSVDSVHCHRAWIQTPEERGGLGPIRFPLASDITKKTVSDYNILLEEEGVALRGLYIIDPDGILKYELVHHNDVGRSVEETLRVLQALQAGGLCPMDWRPGDALL